MIKQLVYDDELETINQLKGGNKGAGRRGVPRALRMHANGEDDGTKTRTLISKKQSMSALTL